MKKFVRFIFVLIVIAGALAIFKPSENNFEEWLRADSAKKRAKARGDNAVEKLVDKGLTTATQLQVLANYKYSNHYVIAVVDSKANGDDYKFVGIAGTWIKLP
jgi:hypothetical protein